MAVKRIPLGKTWQLELGWSDDTKPLFELGALPRLAWLIGIASALVISLGLVGVDQLLL